MQIDEQGNLVSPSKTIAGAAPVAGGGLAAVLAAGGGKGRSGGQGASPKLFDKDGSRAVAALAQQVSVEAMQGLPSHDVSHIAPQL